MGSDRLAAALHIIYGRVSTLEVKGQKFSAEHVRLVR